MGKFARLGNDLYNGRRLDRLRRPQVALVRRLGRHRRCVAIVGLVRQGPQLRHRVHRRHRVHGHACPPSQVTQDTADELREAVAGTGIEDAALAGRHHLRRRGRSWSRPRRSPTPRAAEVTDGDPRRRSGATPDDLSQTEIGASWGERGRRARPDRPGRLPGAGGALHLGLLPRVEDVGGRARRAGPRRRHHRRRLRAVRLRGHAGDRDRPPDDPRLLALRHRRRLRQGPREHQEPARAADRRTPRRPTSRSTRPWCARSTPRSWR